MTIGPVVSSDRWPYILRTDCVRGAGTMNDESRTVLQSNQLSWALAG
jgi:hypothetical protein